MQKNTQEKMGRESHVFFLVRSKMEVSILWVYPEIIGFNTKSWSNDLDDLGPHGTSSKASNPRRRRISSSFAPRCVKAWEAKGTEELTN